VRVANVVRFGVLKLLVRAHRFGTVRFGTETASSSPVANHTLGPKEPFQREPQRYTTKLNNRPIDSGCKKNAINLAWRCIYESLFMHALFFGRISRPTSPRHWSITLAIIHTPSADRPLFSYYRATLGAA
jgi:hypothetical protein